MKQTYLFCLLFVSLFSNAQIINFPDTNFKNYLLYADTSTWIASTEVFNNTIPPNNYCKIDINNDGEIQQSEASLIRYLNLTEPNLFTITSLEGINYFNNLETLICNQQNITSLDTNQNSNLKFLNCDYNSLLTTLNISQNLMLETLFCNYNQLSNLNVTQNLQLKDLRCSHNQLTSLNILQNTVLKELNCSYNQLTNLDVTQNQMLDFFYCDHNLLTSLNTSQNSILGLLDCSSNQLTSLNLGQNLILQSLYCSNNLLTSLNLSQNLLSHLNCEHNNLTSLNISQSPLLSEFFCNNNQLTVLDVSQNSLISLLYCNNNQIINLDLSQNNVYYLYCNNNNLQTLNIKNGNNEYFDYNPDDQIPSSSFQNNPNLQYICADEGQIIAIQNKITEYGYTNCHVNTYCTFTPGGEFYTIQGQQKFDNENDGCDITDGFIPNLKYSITDGTISASIISDNSGNYSIPVQAGLHTITPILENPNYFTATPLNAVIDFPTQTSPFFQDFCITPNGLKHDVEVSILPTTVARPGFDATYKIIYKNKGNQVENGTINLQFDDAVLDVININPIFTSQTPNNLNWTYTNLQPFETREINIVFNVNSPMETPAINAGDFLIYSVEINQLGLDEMTNDNSFGLKQLVVNSYDPNDKTCLQGNTISPDKVGEFVHYVIRFENTGTFPAENIVVKDMIDTAKFDVSSLISLNASHNYMTRISGNKVEFIFENINLPFDDANNDGYIAFKIKTLPSLVVGNTFSNSANIYFDYNFPIVTNTATTTIAALAIPSFEFANYFSLYPNPATNELNINLKSAIEINSIQIYNTIGQLVTVQTGNALKVDVSNLKTGNYFIKINTNEGFSTSQFIKE